MKMIEHRTSTPTDIPALIATLNSDDGLTRQNTRLALVRIGTAAVPDLIEQLADPHERLRWEAVKTLSQINDPTAATALVTALEDDNAGIRWLASGGLLGLGQRGLIPLLEALKERPDSVRLREGAHHVLHILARKGLYLQIVIPVLAALEDIEPAIELPLAAYKALKLLTSAPNNNSH